MDNPKSIDFLDLLKQRDELLTSIESDEKRYREAIEEAAELKRLHEAKLAEINELKRYDWRNPDGTGTIADKKRELAKVELAIADESKPLVYWSKYGGRKQEEPTALPVSMYASQSIERPYVIDKVTAKRIYIRMKGADRQSQYDHTGVSISRYQKDQIDIAKTFPQGIKAS